VIGSNGFCVVWVTVIARCLYSVGVERMAVKQAVTDDVECWNVSACSGVTMSARLWHDDDDDIAVRHFADQGADEFITATRRRGWLPAATQLQVFTCYLPRLARLQHAPAWYVLYSSSVMDSLSSVCTASENVMSTFWSRMINDVRQPASSMCCRRPYLKTQFVSGSVYYEVK